MSETSKDILRFYHEIGHRETLQYWRETVPKDVRKIWLRSFVTEVAKDKLLSQKYKELLDSTLREDTREELEKINQKIQELQQRISELSLQLESLPTSDEQYDTISMDIEGIDEYVEGLLNDSLDIQSKSIPEEALEKFASCYFTSFETDQEKQKQFEALQKKAGILLSFALQYTIPEIDVVVLAGSSAIGQRTSQGPEEQDLDFFLLPKNPIDEKKLIEYQKFLYFLYLKITKTDMEANSFDDEEILSPREKEHFETLLSEWKNVIEFFQENNILPDLRIAETQKNIEIPWVGDWHKLAGPHTILAEVHPDAHDTYKNFLDLAITSARTNDQHKGRDRQWRM